MTSKVTFRIIGKPGCSYCVGAKRMLEQYGFDYTYDCVSEDPELHQWFKEQGHATYPQIYQLTDDPDGWEDNHIGGFTELTTHLADLI